MKTNSLNDRLFIAVSEGDSGRALSLLEVGADVHAVTDGKFTLLMQAVRTDSEECIRLLIEQGSCINDKDLNGESALALAARLYRQGCLRQLLTLGAEVDSMDRFGMTPAMWSARNGNATSLATLIEAGADLSLRDARGEDFMTLSFGGNSSEEVLALLKAKAEQQHFKKETPNPSSSSTQATRRI